MSVYNHSFSMVERQKEESIKRLADLINTKMIMEYEENESFDRYLDESINTEKTLLSETLEEKTIRILRGDFEKHFGIPFETFIEVYNTILEECPEKLI